MAMTNETPVQIQQQQAQPVVKRKPGRPKKIKISQPQLQPKIEKKEVLVESKQPEPKPIVTPKSEVPVVIVPIEKTPEVVVRVEKPIDTIENIITEQVKNAIVKEGKNTIESVVVRFSEPLKIEVLTIRTCSDESDKKMLEINGRIDKIREILQGKTPPSVSKSVEKIIEKPIKEQKKDYTKRNLFALFGVLVLILAVGFSGITDHFSFVSNDNTTVNLTSSIPVLTTTVSTVTPVQTIPTTVGVPIEWNIESIVINIIIGSIVLLFAFIIYMIRKVRKKNLQEQKEWQEQLLNTDEMSK